jgi:hypothetical protein
LVVWATMPVFKRNVSAITAANFMLFIVLWLFGLVQLVVA